MHGVIDWRLKKYQADFWKNHKPIYNGFEEFIKVL